MKHLCFLVFFFFSVSSPSYAQNNEQQTDTLNKEVLRLYKAGKYSKAIKIAEHILERYEQAYDPEHPKIGEALNNLAGLYEAQGYYTKAEPLYKRALAIREKKLGPNHPAVGTTSNNLALLYRAQGRYAEAEPLCKRDLQIIVKSLGPDHPAVGSSLNNLASLYKDQGRYAEAEPLFKRSLEIRKKALSPDHPDVGLTLNNLALLYQSQGRYAEAEPLYKRDLEIIAKRLGTNHPAFSTTLNNLALLYRKLGRYAEAERFYKQSIDISLKTLGPHHPLLGTSLNNLAEIYKAQGRYAEAEPLYKRDLQIIERALSPDHPSLGISLNNFAGFYEKQGQYSKAEPLYKRTLKIFEKHFDPNHPYIGKTLHNLARIYGKLNRPVEAAKIRVRLAKMPVPGTRHLPLYFVTNRKPQKNGGYSTELSLTHSLGRIVMQIPEAQVKNRAKRISESLGQLEKARSGKLTTAKALKVVRSRPLKTPEQFAASVRSSQARSAIFKNQALVFVHGYNTNFNDAMKRATQLSFDLQFDGTLMPFTWPSQGKVSGYLTDVEHAQKSIDTLVTFLDQLRDTMPELKINLLAHSLGNKVMLNALCQIAKRKGGKPHNFGQVISAHADVSYDEFEKLTSCFKEKVKGITLYVNEQDSALRFRCNITLKSKCRAGNYARGYHAADVIDTTKMSGGFFRTLSKGFDHDIFVRNPLLFSDIARLILTGQRPVEKRTIEFRPKKGPKGPAYWAYDKSYNPASPFLKAEAR